MRRMFALGLVALMSALWLASDFARAGGDETPSAIAARKKLKQKITIEAKEVGFKAFTDDIKREMDKEVSFKIDNTSGISNNSKVTYSCKDKTVEEVLNELADKYEFGWYIVSDLKDRNDGFVMLRKYKEKERGYKDGKGPKKKASLEPRRDPVALQRMRDDFFAAAWLQVSQPPCRLRTVRDEDAEE
jgi:hypothetical protein